LSVFNHALNIVGYGIAFRNEKQQRKTHCTEQTSFLQVRRQRIATQ